MNRAEGCGPKPPPDAADPPGLHDFAKGYPPDYYAAFMFDPDGNNIGAVFRGR
jgi:hypothetical protein